MAFTDSLGSEWLKTRRSLASQLVIVGAFFTPVIVIGARLLHLFHNKHELTFMWTRDPADAVAPPQAGQLSDMGSGNRTMIGS